MAMGFRCHRCTAVFRDLGQLFTHAEQAHGVIIEDATPEPLTNAERMRARRLAGESLPGGTPNYATGKWSSEAERQAAKRAGQASPAPRRQKSPAPPPAPEAVPVEEQATAQPTPIVARVTAEWDAAAARRVRERQQRRAERRRSA